MKWRVDHIKLIICGVDCAGKLFSETVLCTSAYNELTFNRIYIHLFCHEWNPSMVG